MGETRLPDFKTYYTVTVTPDCVVLIERQKHSFTEQNRKARNGMTKIWPTKLWQDVKAIQWKKDSLFN